MFISEESVEKTEHPPILALIFHKYSQFTSWLYLSLSLKSSDVDINGRNENGLWGFQEETILHRSVT